MYLVVASFSTGATADAAAPGTGADPGTGAGPDSGGSNTGFGPDSGGPADACLQPVDAAGVPTGPTIVVPAGQWHRAVEQYEHPGVRWVWEDTRHWYPQLLARGISVERSHDLGLARNILALSEFAPASPYLDRLRETPPEDPADIPPRQLPPAAPAPEQFTLFETAPAPHGAALADVVAEFAAQQAAVAASAQRHRLALLLAAESAGALIAAEMQHAGIPWRADIHDRILTGQLGPRPREGRRPERLEQLAVELREKLASPGLNPDSPQELLRALHRAGVEVRTTRSWELRGSSHPAIAPLLAYKKLSRLLSANGWSWLDAWVDRGRFHPEYVVGGVVTGRWASRGGGALQIPQQVRAAVRADPGHKLIVADAAQLEPRVLAALAQDSQLAAAAQGADLYQGIADRGFGGDRAQAKTAMLGAMYGATTGESGRLLPQLARTYPKAIGVVERAAQAGEAGQVVSSHLGRSCPPPSERWRQAQLNAGDAASTPAAQRLAGTVARSRGRFTRNFVVQASAAEWALCWLAELRRRLRAAARQQLTPDGGPGVNGASGSENSVGELVFFLHDEVMIHAPAARAAEVCRQVEESAAAATRLMFGSIPLDFAVSVAVVDSYADAK